ncbi:MAG: hypothetical protein KDC05_09845 [Bacteroidales bacterium]|nr:hypothetical protein [Bacteroidales bacterium]
MQRKGLFLGIIISLLLVIDLQAQNAPVINFGDTISYNNTIVLPIIAENFSDIGSCNLKLLYDPAILSAVSVTKSSQLTGSIASNINTPGVITLGWFTYPGLTLPDQTIIFTFTFNRISPGASYLIWEDDGFSCAWSNSSFTYLNDVPAAQFYNNSTAYMLTWDGPDVIAPSLYTDAGAQIDIPIKTTGFNNIGTINLELHHNPGTLTFVSFINTSGFPSLSVDASVPGTILVSGAITSGQPGIFLSDSAVLLTLTFQFNSGSTNLSWIDDGPGCKFTNKDFADLIDTPTADFYIDGYVREPITFNLKVFLEGPFNGSQMNNDLVNQDLIPFTQPYSGSPWYYPGMEEVTAFPTNAIDWVLLEIRDAASIGSATGQSIIAQKACLLMNDGRIRELDGTVLPRFYKGIEEGAFVVIRHRNHLDIISAGPIAGFGSSYAYDFTTGSDKVAGGSNGYSQISPATWGMSSGDGNTDNNVNSDDLTNEWRSDAGLSGYTYTDTDLDGQVGNADKNDDLIQNFNKSSQVPD